MIPWDCVALFDDGDGWAIFLDVVTGFQRQHLRSFGAFTKASTSPVEVGAPGPTSRNGTLGLLVLRIET